VALFVGLRHRTDLSLRRLQDNVLSWGRCEGYHTLPTPFQQLTR
jgi:hypothetical protein